MTKFAMDIESVEAIRASVIETLRTIFDPEIPVNVYDLGLIYGIDVRPSGTVNITMTLTSPGCPAAEILPPEIEVKVGMLAQVSRVQLEIVWDPPWSPAFITEAAKLQLGLL